MTLRPEVRALLSTLAPQGRQYKQAHEDRDMSNPKIKTPLTSGKPYTKQVRKVANGDKTDKKKGGDSTSVLPRNWKGSTLARVLMAHSRSMAPKHTSLGLHGYTSFVTTKDIPAGTEILRIADYGDHTTAGGDLAKIRADLLGDALKLNQTEKLALLEEREAREEEAAKKSARAGIIKDYWGILGEGGFDKAAKKLAASPHRYGDAPLTKEVWDRANPAKKKTAKKSA